MCLCELNNIFKAIISKTYWSFIFSGILFKLTNSYVIIIWEKKKTISENMSDFFQLKCFDRDNYLSKRNLTQK